MEQNTTRIAMAVGGKRVDVTLPARRPVAEFLPQLVELVGPRDPSVHGWHLVRVGGTLVDPERTLVESAVVDGELIQLAPALAFPESDSPVDDVPAAVAVAASSPRSGRSASGHVCHALAAAVAVSLALILAVGDVAGGVLAAFASLAMVAGAASLRRSGRDVDASIWAFTAIVPAVAAGWTIGRASATVWWVPAVVAGAVAAVAAAVAVPARQAILVPLASGFVASAAWCVVFATTTREPGVIGGPVVIGGLVIIDLVPRLAFHWLGVGRLHRGTPTRRVVDERVRRSRLMIVAGNVTGAVLVLIGTAALAAGSDPWGWGLAAAAGLILAVHARLYTNLDEMVPLAAAAAGVYVLLAALTLLPEAGWAYAAAASAVLAAALAAAGVRPPRMRPLTRRRLARLEAVAVLPLLVALLMSSGLAETLYSTGQSLS